MITYINPSEVPSAKKNEHVAICVCTYLRPRMLERCLSSLHEQELLKDIRVSLVVVDNDKEGSAEPVIGNFVNRISWPIYYRKEEQRGVASARNAALEVAREIGAEWIAFIDDDEVADRHWISHLMAPEYREYAVLMGLQKIILPEPRPFWCLEVKEKKVEEGGMLSTAYTNNVRFNISLVEAGLRFNERLGLSGGEDSEFFAEANRRGFSIKQTLRAITYETAHVSRLTFPRQFQRAYGNAATNLRLLIRYRGRIAAIQKLHTIPFNFLLGVMLLAVSPIALIRGEERFKKLALSGNDKLARAVGRLACLMGITPQYYSLADGE